MRTTLFHSSWRQPSSKIIFRWGCSSACWANVRWQWPRHTNHHTNWVILNIPVYVHIGLCPRADWGRFQCLQWNFLCRQDLRGQEAPCVWMWSLLLRWLPAVACCIFGYAPSQWTFSSPLEVRLGLLVRWASPSRMPALTGMLAAMYREGFPSRLTQIGGDLWPFTLKVVKCFNNLYFYL